MAVSDHYYREMIYFQPSDSFCTEVFIGYYL